MNRPHQFPDGSWIDLETEGAEEKLWKSVTAGMEAMLKGLQELDGRITTLEAAQPKPLAFPTIDPDLLHAELQAWAASKKEGK